MKNPWSDFKALKPGWTRENRPHPIADAHPSTLKTPANFQDLADARAERAKKRKEAKARRATAAAAADNEEVGPSTKSKAGKKSAKRQKKVVVVSPPEATSSDEEASTEQEDLGTEADVEDHPPPASKKKPGQKRIRIQEPTTADPRATIDTRNLVMDPPLHLNNQNPRRSPRENKRL